MANPTILDGFGESSTNITAPITALKTNGYSFEEYLASANFNYYLNQLYASVNKSKIDGVWEWEIGETYNLYSLVLHNGKFWFSTSASNTSEPSVANWTSLLDSTDAITIDNTDQTKLGSLTIGESIAVTNWEYSTTTITLTVASHNAKIGDTIYVSGLVADVGNAPNGSWVITSVTATTIVYTADFTPTATPSTGTTVLSATVKYGNFNVKGRLSVGGMEAFSCRAWVNFNGTGTVAIRDSGNVSSITDTGVGTYTVNLITAMADINYSAVTSVSGAGYALEGWGKALPTTTEIFITVASASNGFAVDVANINCSVFR